MSRFEIRVPTPFRLEPTVWALRRRPHNAMACWDGHNYRRVLMLGQRPIEVTARQDAGQGIPVLDVDLRGSGGPLGDDIVREARRILERTLGLGVDLAGFYRLADSDPRLQTLAKRFYGMRPPCFPSVFEALVNAIACQQLSLTVGIHLLNRLSERFGPTVSAGRDQPFCFPTPEGLAEADPQVLRDLGFSHAKARFVTTLAVRVASGQLDLEALREETAEEALGASIRHSSSMCRGRHGVGARCGPRLRSECTVVDIPMGCTLHFLLGITHDDPITYATAVDLAGEELPGSPLLL